MSKTGDAMDVDASKGSSKGAFQGARNGKDSEVVCWYCETKGHRASECCKKQKDFDKGQPKGTKKGDSKGQGNKKEFKNSLQEPCRMLDACSWNSEGKSSHVAFVVGFDDDGTCSHPLLVRIQESPEFTELMNTGKSFWPRCLLWHGWLPSFLQTRWVLPLHHLMISCSAWNLALGLMALT